jgi:hypothetical protein
MKFITNIVGAFCTEGFPGNGWSDSRHEQERGKEEEKGIERIFIAYSTDVPAMRSIFPLGKTTPIE